MLPQWISSSRTVQQLEVFKQRLWISLSLSGQQLEVSFLSQRIWWSLTGQRLEVFKLPQWISWSLSGQQLEVLLQYFPFCFSIVAQRPRVSPPSRPGAADGLWVPLAHGLMRTPCDEQKRHWYCIMEFATHTSGKAPSSTRAPSKAP